MDTQETKKECVHVKTQEEWDYVSDKICNQWDYTYKYPCRDLQNRNKRFTYSNALERGYTILTFEEFKQRYEPTEAFNPQPHYDNSKGSLYKVAEDRNWNSYQFDIIKRIDRAIKKGKFEEDLQKTKDLIDLWLLENENNDN